MRSTMELSRNFAERNRKNVSKCFYLDNRNRYDDFERYLNENKYLSQKACYILDIEIKDINVFNLEIKYPNETGDDWNAFYSWNDSSQGLRKFLFNITELGLCKDSMLYNGGKISLLLTKFKDFYIFNTLS